MATPEPATEPVILAETPVQAMRARSMRGNIVFAFAIAIGLALAGVPSVAMAYIAEEVDPNSDQAGSMEKKKQEGYF